MATADRPVILVLGLLVCVLTQASLAQEVLDTGCGSIFNGRCGQDCDFWTEVPLSNHFCGNNPNVQCCARVIPCPMYGGRCASQCSGGLVELNREALCPEQGQRCCVRHQLTPNGPPPPAPTTPLPPPPPTMPPATRAPPPPTSSASISSRQGACGPDALLRSRVLNGFRPEPCNWPWMVALRRRGSAVHCSGVLIKANIVLTAVQCLQGVAPSDLEVILGAHDLLNPVPRPQLRDVIAFRFHDAFRPDIKGNNLAAMLLSAPAELSSCVQPACLADPTIPIVAGKRCYVAGFGLAEDGATSNLNVADVTVLEHTLCQSLVTLGTGRFEPMSRDLICSNTDFDYSDLCRGDEGGMLVCQDQAQRWALVGLVAYYGCDFRLPILYTNTTAHADWILQTMGV